MTPADNKQKPHGRWKQRLALALLVVVGLAILALSALKVHETWVLPGNDRNLNARALAKIEKDWEKFDNEFIDRDGRTHGYSMAVISDNHSSRGVDPLSLTP